MRVIVRLPGNPSDRLRSRPTAFLVSAILHASIAASVPWVSAYLRTDPPYPGLNVVMLPKQNSAKERIIWFTPASAIPDVAPDRKFGPAKTPQGQPDPTGQTLIAHSDHPQSTRQLIFEPEHPEPLPADVPTPNRVLLAAPASPIPKPPVKAFVPPPSAAPKPQTASPLLDSPLPPDAARGPLRESQAMQQLIHQVPASAARPVRLFVPPSQGGGGAPAATPQLPDAPALAAQPSSQTFGSAAGTSLQAVVAGLNPAPGPLPAGSRGAEFARAPAAGPASSGSAAKPGSPSVPGLVAHNAAGKPVDPSAPTEHIKVPERLLVKETSYTSFNRTLSAPLRPSSRVIPAVVEAQFANRNVYTLVLPRPDLPEYSDDWVLWFSERQPGDNPAPRISAPVPARKYSLTGGTQAPNAPASGTLQIAAVVDRKGRVSATRILRGSVGDLLRSRALEELQNWEFQPASRNGEPIDVDIVVEIAFQFRAVQQAR